MRLIMAALLLTASTVSIAEEEFKCGEGWIPNYNDKGKITSCALGEEGREKHFQKEKAALEKEFGIKSWFIAETAMTGLPLQDIVECLVDQSCSDSTGKGKFITTTAIGDRYRVEQVFDGGVLLERPYGYYEEETIPVIISTSRTVLKGWTAHQFAKHLKYEGLDTFETVTGATRQALYFSVLD